MALHLDRLRGLPLQQRSTALTRLATRLSPGSPGETLRAFRAAVDQAGLGDTFHRTFPQLFETAPASPAARGCPVVMLTGKRGHDLMSGLMPLLGQAVTFRLEDADGRRHVLSGTLKAASLDSLRSGVNVQMVNLRPRAAMAARREGEAIYVPDLTAHVGDGWPELQAVTFRVNDSSDVRDIVYAERLPDETDPVLSAGSCVDAPGRLLETARAIQGQARERPDPRRFLHGPWDVETKDALEQERKANEAVVIAHFVKPALTAPEVTALSQPNAFGGDDEWPDSLKTIAQTIDRCAYREMETLLARVARGEPGVAEQAYRDVQTLASIRSQRDGVPAPDRALKQQIQNGTGAFTGMARVVLRLYLRERGRRPTVEELRRSLHSGNELIIQQAAATDLRIMQQTSDDLFTTSGDHFNSRFFQLADGEDATDVVFHPAAVEAHLREKGSWLDMRLPHTSGCPARALGTLAALAKAVEPLAVLAYAEHLGRPAGLKQI